MKIISQKDAEDFIRGGGREFRYSRTTQLTPGARDAFSQAGIQLVFVSEDPPPKGLDALAVASIEMARNQPEAVRTRLFTSPETEKLKLEICDIGRRLWQREYVDGNGGNISIRIGPNEVLCTPTLVSKGFLKPEMICLVDLEGNQIAGSARRTSEITTHLAIYKAVPEARAVVHAHPVHATAFAISGVEPPERLIPEMEVFVGRAPIAPYRKPGSREMQEVIAPLAPQNQSILMGNHGVITWSPTSVEDAYFKMEITDAYCRTVVVASHIPNAGTAIPCEEMDALFEMKKSLGLPDPRFGLKPVELCEIDPWQHFARKQDVGSPKSACGCNTAPVTPARPTDAEVETAVQRITDQIVAALSRA